MPGNKATIPIVLQDSNRSPACRSGSHDNYPAIKSGMPGTKTINPSIWQDRFYEHTIRNEYELSNYFDYIHFNPVKHGYVNDPGDWEYSSFRKYRAMGYYGEDLSEMGIYRLLEGNLIKKKDPGMPD